MIDEEPLIRTKTDQFMVVRAETRAIFGEECDHYKLPAVIARLADLLPPSSCLLPPLQSPIIPQPPIFPAGTSSAESMMNSESSSEGLFLTLRERLLVASFDLYKSLSSTFNLRALLFSYLASIHYVTICVGWIFG